MNELTETEKAYLAGFFDGDGSVRIDSYWSRRDNGRYWKLVCQVAQRDRGILDYLRQLTGVGSITTKSQHGCYEWRIQTRQAATLLQAIFPWLIVKKDQAEIALEFAATRQPGRNTKTTEVEYRYYESLQERIKQAKRLDSVKV